MGVQYGHSSRRSGDKGGLGLLKFCHIIYESLAGDHLILGGYDKRVCWFDLDLSNKPYRIIRYFECITS